MKIKILLLSLPLFLILSFVSASFFNPDDITFSINQSEYYFKIGEDAIIPLETENSYKRQINGTLSYTYTQEVNQGGTLVSSSNTQSIPFFVKKGENIEDLNFGTSQGPATINFNLDFSYTEKKSRIVNLDEIKIHFVSDESQKQNKQDKQTSSSEKYSPPKEPSQQQDPFSQIQEKINQMMGREDQQQNQQTTQQKMQNNQLGQDSSALKKQIKRQIEEQEQLKQKFQKHLLENKELQGIHQELINQGYNPISGNLNPTSENSGRFDLHYQNQKSETAELKGEMENGEIKTLQKLSQEDKNRLIQQLQQNKNFQKYNNKLNKTNFKQQDTIFSLEENKTNIKINYQDSQNQTAFISAEAINGTIKNIKIDKLRSNEEKNYFWLAIILTILLILSYFIYKKYFKKLKKKSEIVEEKQIITENLFDYKNESKKLLNQSKKLFERQKYKDAYEKVGQALRLFLSYKYGLKKEVTNDEILKVLKNKNTGKIKQCFDLCSLVEFAKYNANKKDFEGLVKIGEDIIN